MDDGLCPDPPAVNITIFILFLFQIWRAVVFLCLQGETSPGALLPHPAFAHSQSLSSAFS